MNDCELLDDYLDGDLAELQAEAFRAHVTACVECTANLQAHEEFVALVGQAKAAFDEHRLAGLKDHEISRWALAHGYREVGSGKHQIVSTKPRARAHRLMRGLALVASVALVIAAWNFLPPRSSKFNLQAESKSSPTVSKPGESPEAQVDPAPTPAKPKSIVTVQSNHYIAEPIPTNNPNITVFRMHATVSEPVEGSDSSRVDETQFDLIVRRI